MIFQPNSYLQLIIIVIDLYRVKAKYQMQLLLVNLRLDQLMMMSGSNLQSNSMLEPIPPIIINNLQHLMLMSRFIHLLSYNYPYLNY
jgi:hypothetical protein